MSTREGDATQDERFAEVETTVNKPQIIGYRHNISGKVYEVDDPKFQDWFKDPETRFRTQEGRVIKNAQIRRLTEAEETQAADDIQAVHDELERFSPMLAYQLKQNPHLIPYVAEVQLATNFYEGANQPEPAAEFVEALMQHPVDGNAIQDAKDVLASGTSTAAVFWSEFGDKFSSSQRDAIVHAFAILSPNGADRVAAQALAWADAHGVESEEDVAMMFVDLYSNTYAEQQFEMDDQAGFFGGLDWLQENIGQPIVDAVWHGLDSLVTSPEEAARRKDLSMGERTAVLFGVDPGTAAWDVLSGTVDGYGEVAFDPLNLAAGAGMAVKALKTVSVGSKVIKAGKLAAIGRTLRAVTLPRRLSGVSQGVRGGRTARAVYAWSPKTLDDLLDGMVKNGVAGDVLDLAKSGRWKSMARRYPQFDRLSDLSKATLAKARTPEEVVEVLRHSAANNILDDGFDAVKAADEALEVAAKQLDDLTPATRPGVVDEILENPDDFIFHGTTRLSDESLEAIERGEDAFTRGGLTNDRLRAEQYAQEVRPAGAGSQIAPEGAKGRVLVFRKADLPDAVRARAEAGEDIEELFPNAEDAFTGAAVRPVHSYLADEGLEAVAEVPDTPRKIDAILARADELDSDLVMDVLLKSVDAQRRADAGRRTLFTLWDVPRKIPKYKAPLASKIAGRNKVAQAGRRVLARSTGSKVEDQIDVWNVHKGGDQIEKLLYHFGLDAPAVNASLDEWYGLRTGERFDWVMDTLLPRVGEQLDLPVLEYSLKEYFTKRGIRRFASGVDDTGVDHWIDDAGRHRYDPIIPNQLTRTVPIPVDEIGEILRRSRQAQGGRAIALRGWRPATQQARRAKVAEFFQALKKRGHLADDAVLTPELEDQLFQMAYSYVNNIGDDGRGVLAGTIFPKVGNVWGKLHGAFTKNMLWLRPYQWMLRVAVFEEQLRAYMMNMPSFYRNPITYMHDLREAALLTTMATRRSNNLTYANEVYTALMGDVKSLDQAETVLRQNNLWRFVEEGLEESGEAPSLGRVQSELTKWLSKAVNDHTRLDHLSPIKKASLKVRRNSKLIDRGENILKEMGLPDDWNLVDETTEIQQRMLETIFGRQIGASSTVPRHWNEAAAEADLNEYGYAYGQKLVQFLDDPFARVALRRVIAQRAGKSLASADATGRSLINHSEWNLMRDMLAERFRIFDNDVALAERYLDEVLTPEVKALFEPLTQGMDEGTSLSVLTNIEMNRRYKATLGGVDYDIDMSGGNAGGAFKDFGNLVQGQRHNSDQIKFPRQIMGNHVDMRFMANDDPKLIGKLQNRIIQFAGEQITQNLNRRPAYIRTYKRFYNHYTDLGVAQKTAAELAHTHAVDAVNYVYFNGANAPYYVQKMNRAFPFFTATYEVMGAWIWKMPKSVGGATEATEGLANVGHWIAGAGEFARRMQRLVDGLVSVGLVRREKEDDGTINHTVTFSSDPAMYPNEVGAFLGEMGHRAVQGLAYLPEHLINLVSEHDATGIFDDGVALTVGHPLSFVPGSEHGQGGVLSFANFSLGLSPVPNAVFSVAAVAGVGADRNRAAPEAGESLADVAARTGVDPIELARLNRGVITDESADGFTNYEQLLAGQITAAEIVFEGKETLYIPGTGLWENLEEIFMPFGKIEDMADIPMNMVPGVIRWGLMGLGVAQTPLDEFWKGDFDSGLIGALIPDVNQSQMAGMSSEAMMYLEVHDVDENGVGPFEKIQAAREELNVALENREDPDVINEMEEKLAIQEREWVSRVRDLTAGSLVERMLLGQFMPVSPRHVRAEQVGINMYWQSRDYADLLRSGGIGMENMMPFKSEEQIEEFFGNVASWLEDSTGDDIKARLRQENPAVFAYLTPKTFWGEGGTPPQFDTFEEWMGAVSRGEVVMAPLAVTAGRFKSSAIQADYYNAMQANFGGETPEETVANALNNWEQYQELNEAKSRAYDALFFEDDLMGGEYAEWLDTRDDQGFALEKYQELDNQVRDSLGTLLDMEAELDSTYELSEIENLRSSIRGALGKLSDTINEWEDLAGVDRNFRNPFEEAIQTYWTQVYQPHNERIGALYDSISDARDSEERSLIFEQIKLVRNEYTGMTFTFPGSSVPMPSPLEIQWQRKTEEEREVWLRSRLKNPLEWLDLDASLRITEQAPHLESFLPTSDADMVLYQNYTLNKIRIDEAYEREEISSGERTKLNRAYEEQLRNELLAQGRGDEVAWMDMYPVERLAEANMLPQSLEYLLPEVRWYKQVLEANEIGANAGASREMLDPFYQMVKRDASGNSQLDADLQELGSTLYDETTYDKLLPQLLFGLFDLQED